MKVGLTNRWRVLRSLRSRPFALLWMGQSISILGDGVSCIALVWLVLLLTGSATAMGLVIAVQIIPTVALLLIGGVTADRFPRRLVMLWSDGGRALVTFLIVGLGWFRLLNLWHLLALVLIFGIVDSFFSPAYNAIMPQLVSTDDFSSANALTAFSRQMGRLLGPLLGAACVTLIGPVFAFAFDGLTFVVSALCLLALHLPNTSLESLPSSETSDETSSGGEQPVASSSTKSNLRTLMADIGEGLHYVTGSTWLWVTILVASLANIGFFGPMTVALPKLVHDVFGTGAWLLGILSTTSAAGSIISTFIIGRKLHLHQRGAFAYLAMIGSGMALVMFGLPLPRASEPIVVSGASLFAGFCLGTFGIISTTLMQELVPNDKLGRVSSLDMLGSYSLIPLGFLLVGILADLIGPSRVFIGGGIMTMVLAILALCVRDIRQLQ
jgi:MFS family permease